VAAQIASELDPKQEVVLDGDGYTTLALGRFRERTWRVNALTVRARLLTLCDGRAALGTYDFYSDDKTRQAIDRFADSLRPLGDQPPPACR
jgi:hypothetical protein